MLRPAWPLERLREEADRLWALHIKKNGPALLRLDTETEPVKLERYPLRMLMADTSPMPEDIIAPRVLTPGGLLVLGGAPKVGKSDFLISMLVHMAAGVPFTPARVVDHITPIKDGGERFCWSNLQPLCISCHNRKTAKETSRKQKPQVT